MPIRSGTKERASRTSRLLRASLGPARLLVASCVALGPLLAPPVETPEDQFAHAYNSWILLRGRDLTNGTLGVDSIKEWRRTRGLFKKLDQSLGY